jgi:hypothetical protein
MICRIYCLSNVIRATQERRMRWAGLIASTGGRERCRRGLVGKPEGKRLLGRPRRKWDCNIKLDFNITHFPCNMLM